MQTISADRHESTDLDQRDVRALTEHMTTLPLGGDVYSVTTQSGSEYRVDALKRRCTCPDAEYNLPTDDGRKQCKHSARVAFATGARPIPAWVDTGEIDAQLGEHVEGTPKVAVTDGGVTLESFVTDDADDRPECNCDELRDDFPCWPCVRDGRRDLPGEGK